MTDPLDPQLMLELTRRAKKQLRKRLKSLRSGYPRPALARRSAALLTRLEQLPEVREARRVALFHPMVERGEVDLIEFDQLLRRRGVSVYYPFMRPKQDGGYETGFALTAGLSELSERGRGFQEPLPDAVVAARGDIDVVVVPALAADGRAHRLGYGSGFYDATLADVAPPAMAIVVVFDFQLLAEIPTEQHDVPCDVVVTDERILRPGPSEPGPNEPSPNEPGTN